MYKGIAKGITLIAVFQNTYPSGKIWKILPDGEWGDDVDSCYVILDPYKAEATKGRLFGLSAPGIERVLQEAFSWSWRAQKACCERHNTHPRLEDMPAYEASFFSPKKENE